MAGPEHQVQAQAEHYWCGLKYCTASSCFGASAATRLRQLPRRFGSGTPAVGVFLRTPGVGAAPFRTKGDEAPAPSLSLSDSRDRAFVTVDP